MTVKIQTRRDTAANWTSANPVLASGEPGFEVDTNKLKIGDGSTAWNSLAYVSGGGSAGGSSGQIQYNDGGAFAGIGGSTVGATGDITLALNGAPSTPPLKLTGSWLTTGGDATTTKPQLLIEPNGTNSTAWSNNGTGLGVNATSGFTGNLLDLQVNGTSRLSINSNGLLTGGLASLGLDNFIGASLRAGTFFQLSVDSIGIGLKTGIGAPNVYLVPEDGNNILTQRNGANPQTFRIYNTYTNSTNYERLSVTWDANVCYAKLENAGTGSPRIFIPVTGATTVSALPAAATAGAGARAFVTDANSTTFLATAVGGGSNKVPVVSDGANWLIG